MVGERARHHAGNGIAAALVLWVVVAAPAQGSELFALPLGQNLTLGGGGGPRTVQTATSNPAAPVTSDLGGFWFGLGGAGVGYEVGDFNDLIKQANDLQDDLDQDQTSASESGVEQRTNAFIASLNDKAVVKVFANAQPPFLPMGGSIPGLGGAITLGVTAIGGARVDFLGRPGSADVHDKSIPYDPNSSSTSATPNCTGADPNGCQLDADIAGYGKGAAGGAVSVGYSGGVLHRMDGSLFVGGRLNYYTVELSKGVVVIGQNDSSGSNDNQNKISDEFDRHRLRSNAMGLDLGLLWAAYNFRAGATLRDVNEPSFDYPEIGRNCAGEPAGPARDNCNAAVRFSASNPGQISLAESFTMKRQLQFETALYDADRTWSLGVSYDANSAPDATGDDYQWLAASASFSPRNWGWLVPALRAGYRTNQAGSKLDMVSAGLSLFRVLNLDAAMALDKIENDGKSVPRSAMANLSFELYF